MKKSQLKKAAAKQAAAAAEAGRHLWDDAVEKAVPAAKEAGKRTVEFASRALDELEPHIQDALSKVSPAVDAAADKLSQDILPGIQEALHKAANNAPAVVETVAAPAKKKRHFCRKFFKFALLSTIVAGAVAAVRHFLTPKDDGWTAHEPSRAYINNNDTFATAAKFNEPTQVVTEEPKPQGFAAQAAANPAPAAPKPAAAPAAAASQPASDRFGKGSYVGDNPPEGFIIKGNDRSRKYHVPGTRGYELTIAEVWFNSEEAAQAAGFTKAQR